MGRGDKRTKKGKIFKGSYGVTRTQRTGAKSANSGTKTEKAPAKKSAKKKK